MNTYICYRLCIKVIPNCVICVFFYFFFVQPGGADSLFQLSQGDSKLKTDPIPLLKPQQELT